MTRVPGFFFRSSGRIVIIVVFGVRLDLKFGHNSDSLHEAIENMEMKKNVREQSAVRSKGPLTRLVNKCDAVVGWPNVPARRSWALALLAT